MIQKLIWRWEERFSQITKRRCKYQLGGQGGGLLATVSHDDPYMEAICHDAMTKHIQKNDLAQGRSVTHVHRDAE